MLTEEFENNRPKAEVVNGGLVLSFPNAVTPIVWRHSLDKMDDVSFQLLYEGNICILAIKTATGHLKEVARFASRDDGKRAMMLATEALFSGGGFLSSGDKSGSASLFSPANIFVFLLLIAVIGGGIMYYRLPAKQIQIPAVYNGAQAQQQPVVRRNEPAAAPVAQAPAEPTPREYLDAGKPVDADALFAR